MLWAQRTRALCAQRQSVRDDHVSLKGRVHMRSTRVAETMATLGFSSSGVMPANLAICLLVVGRSISGRGTSALVFSSAPSRRLPPIWPRVRRQSYVCVVGRGVRARGRVGRSSTAATGTGSYR